MTPDEALDHAPPVNLDRFAKLPNILIGVGGLLALIGAFAQTKQFGFSYLLAFMFFSSLCIGGLFLTIAHHLFDANWSLPLRRVNEHLAFLAPVLAVLFIPIAVLAPKMYPWMTVADPHADHALHAKMPLFTIPGFYVTSALILGIWCFFSWRLRAWSLKQDQVGGEEPTRKMRVLASFGVVGFAVSLTFAAIMWMKALMHQWFSTMYGVWYFAGSVWTTLITVWVIMLILKRNGPLKQVAKAKQFYFTGSLFFAFTVFYAYITFSQYFIIWNANIPEETFWYIRREKGSWWDIGQIIIFCHFFVPFLMLLRIDFKLKAAIMIPLMLWAWLMHFIDLSFNIMPVLHPDGFVLHWLDIGCFALIGGVLAKVFVQYFKSHPPYPLKDPRLCETLGIHVPRASEALGAQAGHAK